MRVAEIGDNCIDLYERLGKKYPTGNVVDTGVNLKKLGADVSIISTTGNDENGKWMIEALKKEGLDISHLKVGDGPTAITYMDMDGNDRVHGDYVEGVLENIEFDEEDVRFACEHDLVHTALWGKAENVLPAIAEKGVPIAFDYADRLDHQLVEDKGRDEYIESFLKDKVDRGMKIAVATFGEGGSLAHDGNNFYQGQIVPAKQVVNTVGAGDSFIAGFLYGILTNQDIPECLQIGAKVASSVVEVFEPWVIEEE